MKKAKKQKAPRKTTFPTLRQHIVCFGDSITAGNAFAEGERWTSQLASRLESVAPGKFRIWNRGIGGNTSANGLDRFQTDIVNLLPATVLIEFGLNDANVGVGRLRSRCGLAAFKDNLSEIVELIRRGGGHPVLVVNHCIATPRKNHVQGNGKDYMENFKPYQAAIRSAARQLMTPIIDLERMMQSANVVLTDLLGEDGLHLSERGNAVYAGFLLKGLLPLLGPDKSSLLLDR